MSIFLRDQKREGCARGSSVFALIIRDIAARNPPPYASVIRALRNNCYNAADNNNNADGSRF